MNEIIDVIGNEAALILFERFGGLTCYIGKKPRHDMTDAIGVQAALKLSQVFDGCQLYIPNSKAAKMAVRNQSIKNDRAAGSTVRELAKTHSLSDRRIFSICG